MQQHKINAGKPLPFGSWVTKPPKDEPLGSLVVVPANSKPQATARLLRKSFPAWWWVEFVKAVLEEPIGDEQI